MNGTGRLSGERAFTIAVFGLSLALLLATVMLEQIARRVPILVVVPVVVLSGLQLVRELARSAEIRDPAPTQWMALTWICLLPVSIYLVGLYAGAGLFTTAFVRRRGRDSWTVALGLAACVTAGVWLLVGVLMGSMVPTGAFWEVVAGRFR